MDTTKSMAESYRWADLRDAEHMRLYVLGREKLLQAKRLMLLSGLAAFDRNVAATTRGAL